MLCQLYILNVSFLSLSLLLHSFNEIFLTEKNFSVIFSLLFNPFFCLKNIIYSMILNGLVFCCMLVCVCTLPFIYSLNLMFLFSVAQFCQRLFSSCIVRAAAFKSIHCLRLKNLLTYHT